MVQIHLAPPYYGRLAQLARASRLHREGRGFEPLVAHHNKTTHWVVLLWWARMEKLLVKLCSLRYNNNIKAYVRGEPLAISLKKADCERSF